MGIKGKFEVEFDMNCNVDLLFGLFTHKLENLCDISPTDVHGCELHEGEFGKVGSIVKWNFTLDGQQHFGKELTEEIDEENKLVRFKVLEGDILNEFVSVTTIIQMSSKEESLSGIKWTVEFEKMHDDGHYPTKLIDLLIKSTKNIETHHQQAAST